MAEAETYDILTLTTEIVSSFIGNGSPMKADEIPALIRSGHCQVKCTSA